MEHPQEYQPLSHGFNPNPPALIVKESAYTHMSTNAMQQPSLPEDQAEPSSSSRPASSSSQVEESDIKSEVEPAVPTEKRRPGRPKGSKNRRPRDGLLHQAPSAPPSSSASTSNAPPPVAAPADVNMHNQQYYEFQWRVLNLCGEFYGAAEELIKATPPMVIAQCYQMDPTVHKVDPLVMLNEAKRICDTLLEHPSRLIAHPPPPMFTAMPSFKYNAENAPVSKTVSASVSAPPPPPSTQGYPQAQPPYYGYPSTAVGYYAMPPSASSSQEQSQPSTGTATFVTPQVSALAVSTPTATAQQGQWTPEEEEKLRKLAELSKSADEGGKPGEPDWDWVVTQWGPTRTKHQIKIKATKLDLKASSTRKPSGSQKRKHDSTEMESPPSVVQTPSASPVMSTLPRPPASTSPPNPHAQQQQQQNPWPMPTVAVDTPSPLARPSSYYQSASATGLGSGQQYGGYRKDSSS